MRNAETVLGIIRLRRDTGRAGCSERVRRENGESNPCRRQGKPGEVLPGQPSYPKVKASRDKSMAVKRGFGRTCQTQRPARPAR